MNEERKDEIRRQAREFVEDFFSKIDWEVFCTSCKASNCKANETCISCGCQL